MIHRAFFGSLERFIGILIENYAGKLPNWLMPIQVAIATINDNCITYSNEISDLLKKNRIRVKIDSRNEKLNYKIRELVLEKIPFLVVIGDKEVKEKTISLRLRGENKLISMTQNDFLKKIKNSCSIA